MRLSTSILYLPFNNFVLLPLSVVCAYFLFKGVFAHRVFRVVFFFPSIISIGRIDDVVFVYVQYAIRADCQNSAKYRVGGACPSQRIFRNARTYTGNGVFILLMGGNRIQRSTPHGRDYKNPRRSARSGKTRRYPHAQRLFMDVEPLIFPTISTLFITEAWSSLLCFCSRCCWRTAVRTEPHIPSLITSSIW